MRRKFKMGENRLLFGIDGLPNTLSHHGVLGQKWGVRKYQNPDGTLTPAGKKRYFKKDGSLTRKGRKWDEENKKQNMLDFVKKHPGSVAEENGDVSLVYLPTKKIKELGGREVETTIDFDSYGDNPTKINEMANKMSNNQEEYAINAYRELTKILDEDMTKNPENYDFTHISGYRPKSVEELLTNAKNNMLLYNHGNQYIGVSVTSDIGQGWYELKIDPETMKPLPNSFVRNA